MSDREDDDLFGSGSGEDVAANSDAAMDDIIDDVDAVEEEEEEEEPKRKRVVLPRLAPSHGTKRMMAARVPAFLRVDPKPFDADEYITSRTKWQKTHSNIESLELEAALEENAIRWKYAASKEGDKGEHVTKVSNARIVEWSDGSKTLQLGSEQFEIRAQKPFETTFVCQTNADQKALQTVGLVKETLTFLPTSTTSATHLKLAKSLAQKQEASQVKIGSVFSTEDPEKVRRDLEKAVQMKERSRRKLASQRGEEEIISYTDRSAPSGGTQSRSQTPTGSSQRRDEEDEEEEEIDDRFVRDDDSSDEDDARAQRLQQAKSNVSDDDQDDDSAVPEPKASREGRPIRRTQVLDDDDSD